MFLIQNNKDLLLDIGFTEHDFNCLNLEFGKISKEQHEGIWIILKKRGSICY